MAIRFRTRPTAATITTSVVFFLFVATSSGQTLACPQGCSCGSEDGTMKSPVAVVVRCDGLLWTELPVKSLPPSTTTLDISRNELKALTTSTFYYNRALISLNLSHNLIETIEDGSFGFMNRLEVLDLSGNRLTSIRQGTFHGAQSLLTLDLTRNRLTNIDGAFSGMTNLSKLDLRDNSLTALTEFTFRDLDNLRNLDLTNNEIRRIDRRAFRNLEKLLSVILKANPLSDHVTRFQFNSLFLNYLDLSECGLTQVPRGLGDSMRYLQLRRNNLTLLNTRSFADCPYVNILVLDENQIHSIEDGTFERMIHLQQLWLNDNRLQQIPRPLPMNLRRLLLDSNSIREVSNIFPPRSQIETLSLVNNHVISISVDAFVNLASMHSLDLSNNRIARLQARTFSSNSELRTLQLNKNPLRQFDPRCFHGLVGLRALSMGYLYVPSPEEGGVSDGAMEGRGGQAARWRRRRAALAARQTSGTMATGSSAMQLPDDLFQPLSKLSRLDMDSSPDLISAIFSSDAVLEPLDKLQELSILNSDLTGLRSDFPAFFPSLGALRLSSARWHCDTSLMWLRDFVLSSGVKIEHKDDIKCFTPRSVHSRPLISLADTDFIPTPTTTAAVPKTTAAVPSKDGVKENDETRHLPNEPPSFDVDGWRDYEVSQPESQLSNEEDDDEDGIVPPSGGDPEEYIEVKNLIGPVDSDDGIAKTKPTRKTPPRRRPVIPPTGAEGNEDQERGPRLGSVQVQGRHPSLLSTTSSAGGGDYPINNNEGSRSDSSRNGSGEKWSPRRRYDDNESAVDDNGEFELRNDAIDPFKIRVIIAVSVVVATILIATAIIVLIVYVWHRNRKQSKASSLSTPSTCDDDTPTHRTVIKYKNKNGVLYFSTPNGGGGDGGDPGGGGAENCAHSLAPSSPVSMKPPNSMMASSSSMPEVHIVSTPYLKTRIYKWEDF